jgi:Uma2 family endonuclease
MKVHAQVEKDPSSMAAPTTTPQPPAPPPRPALENGDRLTREEFEFRYDAMPHLKKAELIDGVVHVPSPVRFDLHGEQHADLVGWLAVYRVGTPGVRVGDNSTVRLDMGSEPQPDVVMIVDPTRGGQARIGPEGYLEAAPELVAEVAASSVSIDLHAKFAVYLRNRVREYLVWRVQDRAVDWFVLRQDRYERLALNGTGLHVSEAFPGLWLDPAALVRGDLVRVHDVLRQGLAGVEHAAFVARLQAAGGGQG